MVNETVQLERTLRTEQIGEAETDSFWSERNQTRLEESLRQLREGAVVIKTTAELEAMENGQNIFR